jgi:hypothetical protein
MTDIEPVKPAEAAALLGVSRGMVYALAAQYGPIPCDRMNARPLFVHTVHEFSG